MSYYLNADEIFGIAEQIERNGKAFYDAAAEGTRDPEVAALCRRLSAWEEGHVHVFVSLRKSLPDTARQGGAFDPEDEVRAYVRSAAENHVFLKNKDPQALAQACAGGRDVIEMALTFEKDSIVFYTAMARIVPKEHGQDRIGTLIEEELKHIQILSKQLESLAT